MRAKGAVGYKEWEDNVLRKNYHNTKNEILAKALGRSKSSIAARAFKLRLLKDKEFILEHAKKSWFQKGHVPDNKGKKMPYNANSARTRFKKGQIPPNTVPVGTEVVDSYGYRKVKVSDGSTKQERWKYVHHQVWEAHHGEIPKGSIVVFKNGDSSDIRIENLECITRAQHAIRNRDKYPEDIHRLTQMIGALNRQINKRKEA